MLAQFSEALMNVVQRLLPMDQVDHAHQKEALGWMRMANNFAQVFSYSVGALGSRLGLAPLFLFDSATSLSAFFIGRKILPRREGAAASGKGLEERAEGDASRWTFFRCALVLMGWSFFYELFLEGGAGGMALTVLGILVAGWGMASQAWVFGGMLLITLGELVVGSTAQFTLMRLTRGGRKAGFYYSLGIGLMQGGRIIGASVAFPLLIHASRLGPFTALMIGVFGLQLAVLWSLRGEIGRLA